MIVITAPTGAIGSQVLARLIAGPQAVRVIARHPEQIPLAYRQKIDIVTGSHGDRDVVLRAFEGADSVFWLPPGDRTAKSAMEAYVEFSRPACEAIRVCGVKHVVGVSALGRGWSAPAGHVTATLLADDMMAETGVHYRALACGSLMENLLRQADGIAAEGVFYWPSPADLPMPAVATRDVAALAATLLRQPDWEGVETVPLMGPGDISFGEMAAVMSEVLARPIRFQEISMDDMRALYLRLGGSEGMSQAMIDMLTAKNDGMDHLVDRPVPNPSMTDFRTWCVDVLAKAIAERG